MLSSLSSGTTTRAIFSYLTPTEQWILHDYFKPAGDLNTAGLLAHRAAIITTRPSLPQQAGRALSKLYDKSAMLGIERARAKNTLPAKRRIIKQADRQLSVRAVARPEIDAHKLARALIYLARDRQQSQAQQDQDDRSRP